MNAKTKLSRAIEIAVAAHDGQGDKAGAPYILHPLRVMLKMHTDEERIVAVLHDVVEDSDWTFDALRNEGFSLTIIAALACVTKQDGESYENFVQRAASNPIARRVKIADIEDNMDLSRIPNPTDADYARLEKHRRALEQLTDVAR